MSEGKMVFPGVVEEKYCPEVLLDNEDYFELYMDTSWYTPSG